MGATFTNRLSVIFRLSCVVVSMMATVSWGAAPVVDLNSKGSGHHHVAPHTTRTVKVIAKHNVPKQSHHAAPVVAARDTKHSTAQVTRAHHDTVAEAMRNHHETVKVSDDSWMMPANGPVLMTYSADHKGISIGGEYGDPIFAAAGGKVVYASNALKGYGNLIIIKHDHQYLSAYAYNKKMKVKLGEFVKKGQVIGEMGRSSGNKTLLYFEIRKNGKSINPTAIQGII